MAVGIKRGISLMQVRSFEAALSRARQQHILRPAMITFHPRTGPAVECRDITLCPSLTSDAVWIDLFEPDAEEEKAVEAGLGINVPTREEMQ